MYNANWQQLTLFNTPTFFRKAIRLAWLKVFLSQVKFLHIAFLAYRTETIYKTRFNSQIIYLTKVLNDKFDAIGQGIYIDNVADVNRIYIFNKVEGKTPLYLYNKYNPATPYIAGEFAVYGTVVWRCLQASTGNIPAEGVNWTYHRPRTILKNKVEYNLAYDFIVMVPAALVFDINEMKALVNYYKLAGKRFTILTY